MGYKNRKNNVGYLTAKIKDEDLVQRINHHCKRLNIGVSDYVSKCVRKASEDFYSEYLQTLSKDDLIELLLTERSLEPWE